MSKSFFTLMRFMGKVVAGVVVLIAISAGVTSYLNIGESSSAENGMPEVKFSDFEKFKNSNNKVISHKELRALKDDFHEKFLKNFELISKNLTIYADATNQALADNEELEEQLFMIVSRYGYDERTSFLTQLVKETSNLVSYSEEIATDETKAKIDWAEFMDWFKADFEYQLNNNNATVEYITIKSSNFERAAIAGIIIIVIMLSIMMSLILRRDSKTNPIVVTPVAPVVTKTAVKTEAKTTTKAPARRKPAAKKKETVKNEVKPEEKNEVKSEVKPKEETK